MILNVRGFPDELNQALKVEAAKRGMSLRELVIEKCSATAEVRQQLVARPIDTGKRGKRGISVPLPDEVWAKEEPNFLVQTCADIKAQDDRIREMDTRKRDHCPTDRTELVAMGSRAVCPQCGANYPILAQYYYPGT